MNKVGVITFHKACNYGAFLQCLALQKTLQSMNYHSSVIDYCTVADVERYKFVSLKHPKQTIKNIITAPSSIKRNRQFKKAQNMLSITAQNEEYDVAIAGSDQVWNPALSGGKLDSYYSLASINAKKKISYATSIGNEAAVNDNRGAFLGLDKNINHISVREQQAKDALSKVLKSDIDVVVDPTALLTREQWQELIRAEKTDDKEYIFSYFICVRDDQARALAKISEKTGLKTTSFTQIPKEKHIYRYCYSDGPFKFLARLRDSKLVITSSFHGTILSIIFHKNFYVLMPDAKKRSRMDNILKLTGLTDRIIETEADIDKINLENIDYTEPQKKLDKLRQESLDWLKHAIEN